MKNKRVLVCWIGNTDLRAAEGEEAAGQGPIGQAVEARTFDQVVLLSDHAKTTASAYVKWLQGKTSGGVELRMHKLPGPTDFGAIYSAVVAELLNLQQSHGKDVELVFHLSPGTPAMAAVWILLAKTRFPAELIESSKEHGVRTANVPFDISAEFIPELLRRSDQRLERLAQGLPDEAPEFADIIHRSPQMQQVIGRARRVALRGIPVLIEGESGTGKELLARAIHRASPRAAKPFIAVNCGAIPSELVESEFFGHKKGGFTGATADRQGHFESAQGGTLFLDEIGELPKAIQVKLLRVLQEGEVVRVGDSTPRKVDVRIIAATNRTLTNEIATGNFREDLFFRLAVAIIKLPPLRERSGDLTLLIDALMKKINQEASQQPGYKK
jgi:DNA-binding NtrC family response regulator